MQEIWVTGLEHYKQRKWDFPYIKEWGLSTISIYGILLALYKFNLMSKESTTFVSIVIVHIQAGFA